VLCAGVITQGAPGSHRFDLPDFCPLTRTVQNSVYALTRSVAAFVHETAYYQ